MCRRVTCTTCGKATWAGCGAHVDQVMKGVAVADRCTCDRSEAGGDVLQRLARKLFGGSGAAR